MNSGAQKVRITPPSATPLRFFFFFFLSFHEVRNEKKSLKKKGGIHVCSHHLLCDLRAVVGAPPTHYRESGISLHRFEKEKLKKKHLHFA